MAMGSVPAGEFLGAAVLVYLGNGGVAAALLKGSKAEGAGWLAITAAWGFAVVCGVLTAQAAGSPEAHINPAITLFVAARADNWSLLPLYVPAQFLGAFAGAALVWLTYRPFYAATPDPALKLATFCTSPAEPAADHPPADDAPTTPTGAGPSGARSNDARSSGAKSSGASASAWLAEMLATCMLALLVAVIGSQGVAAAGLPHGLGPLLVGLAVWAIGLSLGGPTGYAINPARDLAPRIAHALLPVTGKGDSGWRYAAVPTLAPLAGALLAAGLTRSFGIG